MNAKQFLAEFEHIVNVSGGIQHLRQMIIQLAISGDLSSGSLGDDPVEVTLTESARVREQRINDGSIKIVRGTRKLNQIDKPHDIPSHWTWVSLETLAYPQAGFAFKSSLFNQDRRGLPLVRIRDVGFDNPSTYFTGDYRDEFIINEGDYLISMDGDFRICKWHGPQSLLNQRVSRLIFHGHSEPDFVAIVIQSYLMRLQGIKSYVTVDHLAGKQIAESPIPFPPLNEQKRIVAKVDELMALCDTLEEQQQKRQKLKTLTRSTALSTLSSAQSPHELKEAWIRVQKNLPHMLNGPDDVWMLKQTIIDLGMSGFFLQPDEKVESLGEELLSRIEASRLEWEEKASGQELKEAQLMRKKLKKQKVQVSDRIIPENWAWGTFLQISQAVVDCHNKTAPYVQKGIHLIRTTDIKKGEMDLRNSKKITQETYDYWARRMPPKAGDIFFTREAPMGEAAIVPEGDKVCLGQRTMLVRLFEEHFDKQFLLYAIYSLSFIERMSDMGIGATVKHLRVGDVENLLIPVPPIEEQRIIVRKIQRFIAICDEMQSQIDKENRVHANLSHAAIASITGIQVQEVEKMKAPKTELVTKLKLKVSPNNKDRAPLSAILAKHQGELSAKELWNYSGLEVDTFYQQLKTEIARGWVVEPEKAQVIEEEDASAEVEVA
jgi:type I restriction enzyme S subunit